TRHRRSRASKRRRARTSRGRSCASSRRTPRAATGAIAARITEEARPLRNPHAKATGNVDLQVPAIRSYLSHRGLELRGDAVVDIGTWEGVASHPLSVRLSPLTIACAIEPARTLEQFWQRRKVIAEVVASCCR